MVMDGLAVDRWTEIIVHHAATPDSNASRWEGIRDYHVHERGYRDISYHWGIGYNEFTGRWVVLEGRSEGMEGAHCPGHNKTALGICLLGDFTDHEPDKGQIEVALDWIVDRMLAYGIDVSRVYPHRQFRQTECPGRSFPWERFHGALVRRLTDG